MFHELLAIAQGGNPRQADGVTAVTPVPLVRAFFGTFRLRNVAQEEVQEKKRKFNAAELARKTLENRKRIEEQRLHGKELQLLPITDEERASEAVLYPTYLCFGPRPDVKGSSQNTARTYRHYKTPAELVQNLAQVLRDAGEDLAAVTLDDSRWIRCWGRIHVQRWLTYDDHSHIITANAEAFNTFFQNKRRGVTFAMDSEKRQLEIVLDQEARDIVFEREEKRSSSMLARNPTLTSTRRAAPFIDTNPRCLVPLRRRQFIELTHIRTPEDVACFKELLRYACQTSTLNVPHTMEDDDASDVVASDDAAAAADIDVRPPLPGTRPLALMPPPLVSMVTEAPSPSVAPSPSALVAAPSSSVAAPSAALNIPNLATSSARLRQGLRNTVWRPPPRPVPIVPVPVTASTSAVSQKKTKKRTRSLEAEEDLPQQPEEEKDDEDTDEEDNNQLPMDDPDAMALALEAEMLMALRYEEI